MTKILNNRPKIYQSVGMITICLLIMLKEFPIIMYVSILALCLLFLITNFQRKFLIKDFIFVLSVFSTLIIYSYALAKYNHPLPINEPSSIVGKLANDSSITKSGATLYDVVVCNSKKLDNEIFACSVSCIKISSAGQSKRGIAGERYEFSGLNKISDGFYKSDKTVLVESSVFSKIRRKWLVDVENRIMVLNKYFSTDIDYDAHLLSLRLFTARNTGESRNINTLSKKTGLEYLFALSGMHMSFVVMLSKFIFERVFSKKKAKFLSIILVCLYYFVSSRSPSFTRSFLMVLLALIVPSSIAVLLSFILQIIIFPYSVSNIGFDYSYLAVCGIMLLYKPIYILLSCFIHKKVGKYFALSFSACSLSWILGLINGGVFVPHGILIAPIAGGMVLSILFCGLLLAILPGELLVSFMVNLLYRILLFIMQNLSLLYFEFNWSGYAVFLSFFIFLFILFLRINKTKKKILLGIVEAK